MPSVVRDRRNGRWLARWRDPAGKQHKKSFQRKVDAERFLAGLVAEMNRGSYIDPAAGKVAFARFAEVWMNGLSHLKPSTAARYCEVATSHVLPKWGSWPIGRIARSDVASWVGDLDRQGLAPGTVRKVFLVASMILDAAAADGRIGKNPASGVRLPRQRKREPRFLTPEQLQCLVRAAEGDGLAFAILALTGLRFGEFAALRVVRFDPARARLTVAESVTLVGSQFVWSTPKNHRTRSVPVPPALVPALAAACRGKAENDLIFTAAAGGPIRLNNWRRRVFDPACRTAGLEGLTPHDLRHTAASLAVGAGANVKAVQQMLGHASAAMTLDIYAGLFPDDLDAVGRTLNGVVPQLRHIEGRGLPRTDEAGPPDGT